MTHERPALVMIGGPRPGQHFVLELDQALVGRAPNADIRLDSDQVSRRHLEISVRGAVLIVKDLESANGTYINGRRLIGSAAIEPGDVLDLGDVKMRYEMQGANRTDSPEESLRRTQTFGVVDGPVNTGNPVNNGGNQLVGSGYIHQGDRYEIDIDSDNAFQELFSGKGAGRVIAWFGLVILIIGFSIWMSVIFSGIANLSAGEISSPFNKEILGLNAPITGFAMFGIGGLMMNIGVGMSKAARKREVRRKR
jgi:hypothetical protein